MAVGVSPKKLAEIDELVGVPMPELSVSAATIAEWIGVSPNRVHALARDGVLPRNPDKSFPFRSTIKAYCLHARSGATGSQTDSDLANEKVRLAREQADKIALQNAAARGELLDSRQVANEWRAIVTDLRAAVLAVPSRVASRLALDRKETAALDAEIRDAMEAIADDS